jgi:multidrug efflux pump subunit AcrB
MRFLFDQITRLSLRFRFVTIALIILLLSLGAISWTRLNQELLPPIEVPQTIILTQTSGMTGEEVLTLITQPLETRINTIEEIINVQSETNSSFGSFITAFNDFGNDSEAIQASLQEAVNSVEIPLRRLESDQPAALIGDLDADTIIFLAENDSNFLFQLSPDVWNTLSDETVNTVLAYLAQTTEQSATGNALQRLVDKQISPQLETIDGVANVDVAGGEQVPQDAEESDSAGDNQPEAEADTSLLLRLSPEVWDTVAPRVEGVTTLDEEAVATLSAVAVTIPTQAPDLPESWQFPAGDESQPSYFFTAVDLLEIPTLTEPLSTVINDFLVDGLIIGALAQTNDLTVDTVQVVLDQAPTMAAYFEAEQILALPPEVFEAMVSREDFVENLDAFTRDAVAARQLAQDLRPAEIETAPPPVELPSAWQIQPLQLITFSFSDIPLATFSVFVSGEIELEEEPGVSPPADAAPADETTDGPVVIEDLDEGPALNRQWSDISQIFAQQAGFAIELDTADDLLRLPIPINDITAGLTSDPVAAAFIGPLFSNFPLDAAEYLMAENPALLSALPAEIRTQLPEDVQALLEVIMPQEWNPLLAQSIEANRSSYVTSDLRRLADDGNASTALNTVNNTALDPALATYTIRLMDSLTPQVIDAFITEEPDFFQNLDADVLLKFSSETLNVLSADDIEALPNLSPEQAEQVLAIQQDPDLSAFAEIDSLYATDIPEADPQAPEINPGWQNLGNFYGIELDSADDFFRLPSDFIFPNGAALINGLLDNPQGVQFAPQWVGGLPADAVAYINERDTTFFEQIRPQILSFLSEDALAVLPEAIQQQAATTDGPTFEPQGQITRTNGNDSLFITVFKEPEANTVSTFYDVQDLLETIDTENENIEVGVVFEQSSFIEDSINGVAREGSLGAVFAVIIILIFLSGGTWQLRGRRRIGSIMIMAFLAALLLLVASNLGNTGNDWGAAFDQADVVLRVLLIAGVLAGVFVMFWPGNVPDPAWRATLVIAVSIPLSIMIALVGMYWVSPAMNSLISPLAEDSGLFEFILRLFPEQLTLNIMTLSGLTVAVGRVVDDSIVVLENIFRQLQAGGDKKEAILQGTRDVSAAIFTATLIAVTVFLPLGLTGGLIGAFFLPFGLAVTYALVGSFITALTVIPVLVYFFISVEDMPEDGDIWVASYYLPVLKLALRNGWTKAFVIVAALFSIGIAGFLFGQRPFAFLPSFGEPQITVNVNLPGDTSILTTNTLVSELENWVNDNINQETITAIQTNVGGGGANFETLLSGNNVQENIASITIGLDVSEDELTRLATEIEQEAKFIFNTCPASNAPPNSPEQRGLMTIGEVEGTEDVVCTEGDTINNNVTVAAASVADGGFGGFNLVVSGPLTQELNQEIVDTINNIDGLSRAESNFVPSGDAAGTSTIIRVDETPAVSYTAEVDTENTIGVTQQAILDIQAIPTIAEGLCANGGDGVCFQVSQGFESEIQTEGFQSLGIAMVLAIGLVIIILAATMQSFVYWLAIVFSIAVAPIGAAVALTLADRVLGISALIGLLMLIGLVIANGVVLIDRVRSNRRERGMQLYDALVEAGGRRLRPILMTSLATIIALTPLAIGLSEGAIIASELGTVVIGGVLSSTLLTLIVVPTVFSVLSPLHRLLSFRKDAETRQSSGNQTSQGTDPAPAD